MTSKKDSEASSKPCPICGGSGEIIAKISNFYPAKTNTYEQVDNKGKTKHRIRLEIPRAFHDEFLSHFSHGDELAIFVIPMNQMSKKDMTPEELENAMEGGLD